MSLISPERSAHWYRATDQGVQAFYEMRGKNGKMRAPTVADAREQGLLVSISHIASMLPKPYLEAWKQEQAIMSALTLPRLPDEPTDVFAKRVVKDMGSQGGAARDFGTSIHAQIEKELLYPNGIVYCPEELVPFLVHVRHWIQANVLRVIGTEQIVGDVKLGIGGKLDLHCELNLPGNPIAVVDFKTQGVKNGKPSFYSDWGVQLAGYAHCVKQKGAYEAWPMLVSVVVDSTAPGPVHFKTWGDQEHLWDVFLHCLGIFCYIKDYKPGKT